MKRILIKAVKPHRQKILTEGGEEMRLQQWANRKAAGALRGAGGDTSGEQFTQSRDKLMREALMNPEEHGIKFVGGAPVMFDDMQQPEAEEPMDDPAFDEEMGEDKSFELAEKHGGEPAMPDKSLFDEQGNLATSMPGAETPKPEDDDDDDEPSFLDFYKKSFQKAVRSRVVSFKDAWSVLKNEEAKRMREEKIRQNTGDPNWTHETYLENINPPTPVPTCEICNQKLADTRVSRGGRLIDTCEDCYYTLPPN